jgi:hypothetical protein
MFSLRRLCDDSGAAQRTLIVEWESHGAEKSQKVKVARIDMRTKGQLRLFLCQHLGLEDELTIEIQVFDEDIGAYTSLRSTVHLASDQPKKIRLVRQEKTERTSPEGKRKIKEFTFLQETLGISVTSDPSSGDSCLYISAVAPGGQGEQLGIKQGDIVIGVDGLTVGDCLREPTAFCQHSTNAVDMIVQYLSSQRRPLTLNMLVATKIREEVRASPSTHSSHTPQIPKAEQMMSQMLRRMEMMQDQIQHLQMKQMAEKAVAAEQQLAQLQQQQAEQHANQLQQQQIHQRYQPSESPARKHFLFPFQCCSERMGAPLPGIQSLAPTAQTAGSVPAYAPRGLRDRTAAAQPQPAGRGL